MYFHFALHRPRLKINNTRDSQRTLTDQLIVSSFDYYYYHYCYYYCSMLYREACLCFNWWTRTVPQSLLWPSEFLNASLSPGFTVSCRYYFKRCHIFNWGFNYSTLDFTLVFKFHYKFEIFNSLCYYRIRQVCRQCIWNDWLSAGTLL